MRFLDYYADRLRDLPPVSYDDNVAVRRIGNPKPLLDLAQQKVFLKIDGDDDDPFLPDLLAAAQNALDGPHGRLGRCIGRQTLEATFRDFGGNHSGELVLPYPEIFSITSVTYRDRRDVITVPDTEYYIERGRVLTPDFGYSWPNATGNVVVTYEAGYDKPEDVPPLMMHAVRLMASHFFEFRGVLQQGGAVETPQGLQTIIDQLRVY